MAIENDEFLKPQLDSNEELQLSAASNTKLVMAPALQSVVGHQLAKLEEETAKVLHTSLHLKSSSTILFIGPPGPVSRIRLTLLSNKLISIK